jgi:hypothetical protein
MRGKLVEGTLRFMIQHLLKDPDEYQIATPSATLHLRGRTDLMEFIVRVSTENTRFTPNYSKTEILCAHGQVGADLEKFTPNGQVFKTTVVVNPLNKLTVISQNGLVMKSSFEELSQEKFETILSEMKPKINFYMAGAAAMGEPPHLPGTGFGPNIDPETPWTLTEEPRSRPTPKNRNFEKRDEDSSVLDDSLKCEPDSSTPRHMAKVKIRDC